MKVTMFLMSSHLLIRDNKADPGKRNNKTLKKALSLLKRCRVTACVSLPVTSSLCTPAAIEYSNNYNCELYSTSSGVLPILRQPNNFSHYKRCANMYTR